MRGRSNLQPLGSQDYKHNSTQIKLAKDKSTLKLVNKTQQSSEQKVIAFSPNATRVEDLFQEQMRERDESEGLVTDRQRPLSGEEDHFNKSSVMFEIKAINQSFNRIENSDLPEEETPRK